MRYQSIFIGDKQKKIAKENGEKKSRTFGITLDYIQCDGNLRDNSNNNILNKLLI